MTTFEIDPKLLEEDSTLNNSEVPVGTDDSSVLETPDTGELTDDSGTGNTPVLDETEDAENAPSGQPDTFPRAYVDKLRKEAADNRVKAKQADAYAQKLHTMLVEKTGRLADPTDLPFDATHLDDDQALDAAITDLLAQKPHLASRTPRGNIGQGVNVPKTDDFSLSGWLRGA